MKNIYRTLVVLSLILFLTNCGETGNGDSPEQGAKEWIDSAVNLDGNTTLKRTCLAQREYLKDASLWNSAFSIIGQLLINQKVEGDISDLKFETI